MSLYDLIITANGIKQALPASPQNFHPTTLLGTPIHVGNRRRMLPSASFHTEQNIPAEAIKKKANSGSASHVRVRAQGQYGSGPQTADSWPFFDHGMPGVQLGRGGGGVAVSGPCSIKKQSSMERNKKLVGLSR